MSTSAIPPEPWNAFLRDLDEAVPGRTRLDCIGGFVITQLYGLSRPTADVDVIELTPREASQALMHLAMQGGPLHRKHHIYLDRVAVAAVPENYEDRLIEMFPGAYRNPLYYAQRTVDMASARLALLAGASVHEVITSLETRRSAELSFGFRAARAREIAQTAARMIARDKHA